MSTSREVWQLRDADRPSKACCGREPAIGNKDNGRNSVAAARFDRRLKLLSEELAFIGEPHKIHSSPCLGRFEPSCIYTTAALDIHLTTACMTSEGYLGLTST